MNINQGNLPATKADVEEVAAMANKQFTILDKKVDLVLSSLENLSGQIADVKQSRVSVLDYMRLETRVETVEEQVQKLADKKRTA